MTEAIVVTSLSCHLCEDALDGLAELAKEFPLEVREIPLESNEGAALFERFRPPMPAAVILDGMLFSSGRLPRKKLRRRLERAA
jgi:Glutaredoxin-like domain (DUF836)